MEFKAIETQEAFDAAIKDRIERERAKFADYDELKTAAAVKDGELAKVRAKLAKLEEAEKKRDEDERRAALKAKVAAATGVPADLIAGDDEESMTAFAKSVSEFAKKPSAPRVSSSGSFAEAPGADDQKRFVAELFGDRQ